MDTTDTTKEYKRKEEQNVPEKDSTNLQSKIIWKQSPDLFFLLFSCLMQEGFISSKKKGLDEYRTAQVLYNVFEVIPKAHKKKNYTFNTFYQYLKSSSSFPSEIKQNKVIKVKIQKFLKSLESVELSLFE